MEVSSTGYVVLGILAWRPRSGYDIKQVVDRSTRFFWAASYGQIYPELKRLEREGLVKSRRDPKGGRRRQVYSLTPAGRRELRTWLRRPPETFEMRNEGLLKLFLTGAEPAAEVSRQLEQIRLHSEDVISQLRRIDDEIDHEQPLCLRFGIEMNEWIVEWCASRERELAATERRAA